MKYCPHCNAPLTKRTKICPDCGRPVRGGRDRDEKGSSNTGGCIKLMPVILVVFLAAICMLAFTVISHISKRKGRKEPDPVSVTGEESSVYEPFAPGTVPIPAPSLIPPSPETEPYGAEEERTSTVSVQDYAFTEDVFGHKILTVNLLFTNEGDTPTSYFYCFRADASQNGTDCTVTVTDFDLVQNETKQIQPGEHITVPQSFIVTPDQDIQLTVSKMGFTRTVVLEQTISQS